LTGYIGSGAAYADQTEKDWNELKRSGKAGSKA
jgi:hypothetical protein